MELRNYEAIMAYSYLNFYNYIFHFEFLASSAIKIESIHKNFWYHSHKKKKISLETRDHVVGIFAWAWNAKGSLY